MTFCIVPQPDLLVACFVGTTDNILFIVCRTQCMCAVEAGHITDGWRYARCTNSEVTHFPVTPQSSMPPHPSVAVNSWGMRDVELVVSARLVHCALGVYTEASWHMKARTCTDRHDNADAAPSPNGTPPLLSVALLAGRHDPVERCASTCYSHRTLGRRLEHWLES